MAAGTLTVTTVNARRSELGVVVEGGWKAFFLWFCWAGCYVQWLDCSKSVLSARGSWWFDIYLFLVFNVRSQIV